MLDASPKRGGCKKCLRQHWHIVVTSWIQISDRSRISPSNATAATRTILSVARSKCPDCKGTGRAPVQFAQIMSEIRESHAEHEKQMSAGSREEYSDEDTFVD